MTLSTPYNVLIIGAGKMGAFFDSPIDTQVLSHAHAVSKDERFNLLGFIDTNEAQSEKASALWNAPSFTSLEDVLAKHRIDVVVIASPDETHHDFLMSLVNASVQLVMVEKPFVDNLEEGQRVLAAYQTSSVQLLVNYSRRFIPEYFELQTAINNGDYGQYLSGTGYYGKGLRHNGSHVLDLTMMLLGPLDVVSVAKGIEDYNADDLSYSAVLSTQYNELLHLQAVGANHFTHLEIDLVFASGRIRILDWGRIVETYGLQDDTQYAGHKTLKLTSKKDVALSLSLVNAFDNIYSILTTSAPPLCSAQNACDVLKLCEKIQACSTKSS